jgi:hypothetical protein
MGHDGGLVPCAMKVPGQEERREVSPADRVADEREADPRWCGLELRCHG